MSRNKEHRGDAFGGAPNGAAAFGGRPIGKRGYAHEFLRTLDPQIRASFLFWESGFASEFLRTLNPSDPPSSILHAQQIGLFI